MVHDSEGKPVFPFTDKALKVTVGIKMREYYAAHCPITMSEAYQTYQFSQSELSELADGRERNGFMQWWATLRFEYADAMMKTHIETLE